MGRRIKKAISFDPTAVSVREVPLDIAVPDGMAIRINSVAIMISVGVAGSKNPEQMYATLLAKPSAMTAYNNSQLESAPETIALQSLSLQTATSGIPNIVGSILLDVAPEPYSLAPYVGVGCDAIDALAHTYELLAIVDYDVVKITTAIATTMALR